MPNPLKKPESMYDIILKAVIEMREDVQGTARTCKQRLKQKDSPTDPKVLTQLEESLREQEEYHGYYIKNFLPALKTEITNSKKN